MKNLSNTYKYLLTPNTYSRKEQSGRSLRLTTRLLVNLFFANLKILDVFSIYSLQVSSFMYLYHNDDLPIGFTQIFQTGNQIHRYSRDTLTFTDLIPVEQISKKFRSCFKVLEYGIHYRATSKTP